MNILWLTWKDMDHPEAGGAEVVNSELAKRLALDGHTVRFIVASFKSAPTKTTVDGYEINRLGNKWTLYYRAWLFYKKHLVGWADLVIDEVNTVPFFAKFYVKERNILFVHQLARQIWFYQMIFPLSLVGYMLELLYLRLLSNRQVITVSESTKQDLIRFGFKRKNIHIISEGIQLEPVKSLNKIKKYKQFTLLSFGAVRAMKRTLHQIKAFEQVKTKIKDAKLIVAGDTNGRYGQKVLRYIQRSPYLDDIKVVGKVTKQQKIVLMQKSHLILATSLKEGWGLVVTEAASQGTPAVVYDVDGLRDSVKNKKTGFIVDNGNTSDLADKVSNLLSDVKLYKRIRNDAHQWSRKVNFIKSHEQFEELVICLS